uniref:ATP synthase F0 subunit 8 n=1 Tax=Cheiracanthium triviale TaxID=2653069 RepID=A0A6B9VL42_9ARAC|nr:ATP synthase F0 subunit 8 [Cheiracanthium triviale]
MPLYWVISTFMVLLLMMIVMNIFYYKMIYEFFINKIKVSESVMINFKW